MEIVKLRVTCGACKKWSDVESITNAPVAVVTAAMQAMRCPECGSANVGLGGGDDAGLLRASSGTAIQKRLAAWRSRGDVGISSSTIANAFRSDVPISMGHSYVPQDPADFKRCYELLALIPEWRDKLAVVSGRWPFWRPFVDAWAELEALWAEESPTGKCPRLYERMKVLCAESDAIRGAR